MPSPVPCRRVVATVCLLAATAGCRNTPSEPERIRQPSLTVTCLPAGMRVTCSATYLPSVGSLRTVTSLASWRASDPTLGSFLEPGIFTPVRRGEVELSARYSGLEDRVVSKFLVDPRQTATRLYFLSGMVRDDLSNEDLAGATVEVLDGYARGAQSLTNRFGAYQFDTILTGETFSVRASRAGYAPSTFTYRVDSPIGPAGGNLDFRLRRLG